MGETELTAADVMQVAVKTVPSTMPLPELERQLVEAKVSGFPVVDQGQLVGVVSRSDVVRQICSERAIAEKTSDFYFDDEGFHEEPMESFEEVASRVGQRIEGLFVRDVMVGNPYTLALSQPVGDIARRFVKDRVHRYPVVDGGTLVGIVSTMDLVRLIAEGRSLR